MLDEQQEASNAESADDGDAGESGAATATEAQAEPEAEASAEAPEADAAGDEDDGEKAVDPAVQEYIGQDTTVVHHQADKDEHGVPTEFRTPPGIPAGLDPRSLEDRDQPPRP
jgi:hypothetical protein